MEIFPFKWWGKKQVQILKPLCISSTGKLSKACSREPHYFWTVFVSELPVRIQISQETISAQQSVNQYNPCESVKSIFMKKEEQSLRVCMFPLYLRMVLTYLLCFDVMFFWALHPFFFFLTRKWPMEITLIKENKEGHLSSHLSILIVNSFLVNISRRHHG